MVKISMNELSEMMRKYAKVQGGIEGDEEIGEICDFGDSYGFMFAIEDKFANVYWCINKKTNEPYSFRPNQDIKKFMKRKVIQENYTK